MDKTVLIALITALVPSILTFAGVLVSNNSNKNKIVNDISLENNKVVNDIKLEITKNQAITDTKIEDLTYEVRKHNDFATRIPKLEEQISGIHDKIDILHNK